MTHRERFYKLFAFESVDRIPLYYFGSWIETKERWVKEGFTGKVVRGDAGPQLPGMDPDWEVGLWNVQGLVATGAIGDVTPGVLEENEKQYLYRNALGRVDLVRKEGSSIPHTVTWPLEPTRESWDKFKRYLEPTPDRYTPGWEKMAEELNAADRVTTFMGGSFYGWLRDFMGVENLSYIMYDEPELLEEMVSAITDHFMTLMEPILQKVKFDFVYFFEDCCGADRPLFSPACYMRFFHPYYKKLIDFYKAHGVPYALIDSDGLMEPLIPCWLESGFDILFPLEVGKWDANPDKVREKFGDRVRILGGVDKKFMSAPEEELRAHLLTRKAAADKGGYLPIPDHRVPPEVSLEQMMTYIRVFHEIFG